MDKLDLAIQHLYHAFSDVEMPAAIDGCQCCITAEEVDVLVSKDLRTLTAHDIAPYASSALLTVGTKDDYLYFLPKILEITVQDDAWWPDIEVTGKAIRRTNPSEWPKPRYEALAAFWVTSISVLIGSKRYDSLDGWLCGGALAGLDVKPMLAIIEQDERAILEVFNANSGKLYESKLGNAFWELPNTGHDDIVTWLRTETIARIPRDIYGYIG